MCHRTGCRASRGGLDVLGMRIGGRRAGTGRTAQSLPTLRRARGVCEVHTASARTVTIRRRAPAVAIFAGIGCGGERPSDVGGARVHRGDGRRGVPGGRGPGAAWARRGPGGAGRAPAADAGRALPGHCGGRDGGRARAGRNRRPGPGRLGPGRVAGPHPRRARRRRPGCRPRMADRARCGAARRREPRRTAGPCHGVARQHRRPRGGPRRPARRPRRRQGWRRGRSVAVPAVAVAAVAVTARAGTSWR